MQNKNEMRLDFPAIPENEGFARMVISAFLVPLNPTIEEMADVNRARQPFYTTAEGEERSGMGFTVMESFMDRVEVQSAVGRGTTVRLAKQLNVREDSFARRA